MERLVTNLPFKINGATIVILKNMPVQQCENCSEYLLADPILTRVDEILAKVDHAAELEVIRYAA